MDLKNAIRCLYQIENTTGMNAKRDLLLEQVNNNTLRDILYFVFNPYIRTGIGQQKLLNCINDTPQPYDGTIQGVFTYLAHNDTGRDKDVKIVKFWIESKPKEYKEMLYKIFTKTMNIGISTATINKVWPNLIPKFGVQLAYRYDDCLEELEGEDIFITEKLDGNRCFAGVENGKCSFYSRTGREIKGLDDIGQELCRLTNGWYDGELVAKDFNQTQSQTLRKGKKSDLVFHVFDYLTTYEVNNQKCTHPYAVRRANLGEIFGLPRAKEFQYVKLVPLIYRGRYQHSGVMSLLEEYVNSGSEGLMINLNRVYEFERTKSLIKVKRMYNLDLRVKRVEEGSGQNKGKMGNVIVDYKGYEVGVGSGFSKEQRDYYWKNPDEILEKIIEVQFFEETSNKDGTLSLRFPVFIRIRDDKDTESYH